MESVDLKCQHRCDVIQQYIGTWMEELRVPLAPHHRTHTQSNRFSLTPSVECILLHSHMRCRIRWSLNIILYLKSNLLKQYTQFGSRWSEMNHSATFKNERSLMYSYKNELKQMQLAAQEQMANSWPCSFRIMDLQFSTLQ